MPPVNYQSFSLFPHAFYLTFSYPRAQLYNVTQPHTWLNSPCPTTQEMGSNCHVSDTSSHSVNGPSLVWMVKQEAGTGLEEEEEGVEIHFLGGLPSTVHRECNSQATPSFLPSTSFSTSSTTFPPFSSAQTDKVKKDTSFLPPPFFVPKMLWN